MGLAGPSHGTGTGAVSGGSVMGAETPLTCGKCHELVPGSSLPQQCQCIGCDGNGVGLLQAGQLLDQVIPRLLDAASQALKNIETQGCT